MTLAKESAQPPVSQIGSKMTETEFRKFRKLVYAGTYLFCPDAQKPLFERKVALRLTALQVPSFQAYYTLLTATPAGAAEFTKLIDVVAVHETSFFRIAGHFTGLETHVFPAFLAAAKVPGTSEVPGTSTVRVWSAGCSTGEEPYSIAMTFLEALSRSGRPAAEAAQLKILATDMSPAVIAQAQAGSYAPAKVRKIPQPLLDKYWACQDNYYQVTPQVKNCIQWQTFNLIKLETPPASAFEIIFCRNLLIYFDRAAQKRVLMGLTKVLVEGGYLFLGDAESLHPFPEAVAQFQLIETGDAIFYRKRGVQVND